MAMESQELVLSELSVYVPRSPNSGLSYGVNLDGVVSSGHDDGCTAQADATSADGSNTGGIDNAFGYSFELLGIQPTSPPAESAVPFIASGQLALGLRLRVAQGPPTGLLLADLGVVAQPDCRGRPPDCAPLVVGGAVAPDQVLAFTAQLRDLPIASDGARLRGALGDITVPAALVLGPEVVSDSLTLHDAAIDVAVSTAGLDGSLGGAISLEDFRVAYGASQQDAIDLFRIFADLDPATSDPTLCTRVSVGLHFSAVPADLE